MDCEAPLWVDDLSNNVQSKHVLCIAYNNNAMAHHYTTHLRQFLVHRTISAQSRLGVIGMYWQVHAGRLLHVVDALNHNIPHM
jgi:hypothetical protein